MTADPCQSKPPVSGREPDTGGFNRIGPISQKNAERRRVQQVSSMTCRPGGFESKFIEQVRGVIPQVMPGSGKNPGDLKTTFPKQRSCLLFEQSRVQFL